MYSDLKYIQNLNIWKYGREKKMKILSIINICVSVMNFLKMCSIILIENNNFHFNKTVYYLLLE